MSKSIKNKKHYFLTTNFGRAPDTYLPTWYVPLKTTTFLIRALENGIKRPKFKKMRITTISSQKDAGGFHQKTRMRLKEPVLRM